MINKFLHRKNCLPAAVILIGVGGIIGQLMLIRVLMVIFLGNELSLSLVIASWLLFEGLGSWLGGKITSYQEKLKYKKIFLTVFFVYPLVLVGAVFLARFLGQGMPGLVPGEAMSLAQMVFTSILTVGVTGIVHGSLFPLAAQIFQEQAEELPVSRAYIIEIIGTIAGGLIFVFLLAPGLNSVQISLGLLLLHLPVGLWLGWVFFDRKIGGKQIIMLVTIVLILLIFFSPITSYLHRASVSGLWPEGKIIDYRNSPYGNIVTVTRQQEKNIFYDGRPIMSLPHPDTARLQDYAYMVAGSHSSPEDVLLVGGGLGGLIYFLLDHPLENLVFAELDPELLQIAEEFESDIIQQEFGDERTEMINRDGRLYLNQTEEKYDLIMLGEIDTETLQTNRFFTREFFQLADERLNEQGMLAFTLAGSMTYLGDELELLNSSLYHTVREVFAEARLIPGEQNIILASQHEINLSPDRIAERLKERDLYGGMFDSSYLQFRLDEYRLEEFNSRLYDNPAPINQDFVPAGFLYGLLNWGRAFAPEALSFLYSLAENLRYVLLIGLLILGFFSWRLLWQSENSSGNRITLAISTSGGAAMSFDLFTIFAFQSLFGHIYQLNGLFIAAFMGGMFLGGRVSYRKIIAQKDKLLKPFLQLEITVFALLIIFPLFIFLLREIMFLPAASILGAIFCVIFAVISGGVVGAQFPLAANLLPDRLQQEAGSTAGRLYTADLIGGWLAGMLVGIILFPVLGLIYTMLLLAILKFSSWLLLYLDDKKIKIPALR